MAPLSRYALVLIPAVFTQVDVVIGAAECNSASFPALQGWFEDRDALHSEVYGDDTTSLMQPNTRYSWELIAIECKHRGAFRAANEGLAENLAAASCELDSETQSTMNAAMSAAASGEDCWCDCPGYVAIHFQGVDMASITAGDPECASLTFFQNNCPSKVDRAERNADTIDNEAALVAAIGRCALDACNAASFPALSGWFQDCDALRSEIYGNDTLWDEEKDARYAVEMTRVECDQRAAFVKANEGLADSLAAASCELDSETQSTMDAAMSAAVSGEDCVCDCPTYIADIVRSRVDMASIDAGDPECASLMCYKNNCIESTAKRERDAEDDDGAAAFVAAMGHCDPADDDAGNSAIGPSSTRITASFVTLLAMGYAQVSM